MSNTLGLTAKQLVLLEGTREAFCSGGATRATILMLVTISDLAVLGGTGRKPRKSPRGLIAPLEAWLTYVEEYARHRRPRAAGISAALRGRCTPERLMHLAYLGAHIIDQATIAALDAAQGRARHDHSQP